MLEGFCHWNTSLPEFFHLQCLLEFLYCLLESIELADSTLKQVLKMLKTKLFGGYLSFGECISKTLFYCVIVIVSFILEFCTMFWNCYLWHWLIILLSLISRVLHQLAEFFKKLFINSVGFFSTYLSLGSVDHLFVHFLHPTLIKIYA